MTEKLLKKSKREMASNRRLVQTIVNHEIHFRLQALADKKSSTVSAVVREIITDFFEKSDDPTIVYLDIESTLTLLDASDWSSSGTKVIIRNLIEAVRRIQNKLNGWNT